MSEQDIVARIQSVFEDSLGLAAPAADTDILETGLLDSLALVTLLFGIEQEFGTEIALESLEIDDLRTVARIAQLVGSAQVSR
jgi:D-alanine--poly(phosphoribitol) ligase subunit 2